MPDSFRVNVKGYRQAMSALNRVDKGTAKALRDGLKEAAEPVAAYARSRLSRYRGISLSTIRPRVSNRGVVIRQSRRSRKIRPNFGALQMRHGLIPAAYEGQDRFVRDVEKQFDQLVERERLT